jgi:hypothetical protein
VAYHRLLAYNGYFQHETPRQKNANMPLVAHAFIAQRTGSVFSYPKNALRKFFVRTRFPGTAGTGSVLMLKFMLDANIAIHVIKHRPVGVLESYDGRDFSIKIMDSE